MQADHPLTRNEVIDRYKRLQQRLSGVNGFIWLGGGSALIIHNLRETTMDLDAGCTIRTMVAAQRVLGIVAEEKTVDQGYLDNCLLLTIPEFDTDLHSEAHTSFDDLEQIDGVWVYTLEACLKQKQALYARLNREKDLTDINNIKAAMARG